jgi:SAM-dependent methyltransferase
MNEYMTANRALWDEWTPIHERSEFYDVEGWKAGRRPLHGFVVDEVGDVAGKDLLHLQCHFGLDTLAWAQRGARVTGVDFSERAIDLARSLAAETALEARFVQADVLELGQVLDGDFDVVFTSFGVLSWLPDLTRWARIVARFLRPGGMLYLAEFHPFSQVMDDGDVTAPTLLHPYFPSAEPLVFPTRGSYADPDAQVEQPVEYGWAHSMGEIVTVLAETGLRIEFLHEFPFTVFRAMPFLVESSDEPGTWRLPEPYDGRLPLMFSLKATRPAPDSD